MFIEKQKFEVKLKRILQNLGKRNIVYRLQGLFVGGNNENNGMSKDIIGRSDDFNSLVIVFSGNVFKKFNKYLKVV